MEPQERITAYITIRRGGHPELPWPELQAELLDLGAPRKLVESVLDELRPASKRRVQRLRLVNRDTGRLAKGEWNGGKAKDTHWHRYHRDVFGSRKFKRLTQTERDLLLYAFTKYARPSDLRAIQSSASS